MKRDNERLLRLHVIKRDSNSCVIGILCFHRPPWLELGGSEASQVAHRFPVWFCATTEITTEIKI